MADGSTFGWLAAVAVACQVVVLVVGFRRRRRRGLAVAAQVVVLVVEVPVEAVDLEEVLEVVPVVALALVDLPVDLVPQALFKRRRIKLRWCFIRVPRRALPK